MGTSVMTTNGTGTGTGNGTIPATLEVPPRLTAPAMPSLSFLQDVHPVYALHQAAWEREERRLFGGDDVLEELTQFDGESPTSYAARKRKATYVNFPKAHAAVVTGRLRMAAPTPGKGLNFGTLGDVRSRDQIDTPTFAELLYYNVDGIGTDGSQMPAFFDGVDERAQATGHRWLMVEAPRRRRVPGGQENDAGVTGDTLARATLADVLAGQRPYLVEYSPLDVTNWYFRDGQLQFAVVRVPTDETRVEGGGVITAGARLGFYLLVRKGYTGLGSYFAGGGWWIVDADLNAVASGDWQKTKGQIPMWIHYGETSKGTKKRPAISRSSTMELGQIAVSLMDTISARDYDAWDAAASRLYFLGADPEVMNAVAGQVATRSIMIGVPFSKPLENGTREIPVTVHDGSTGAVPEGVFKSIIEAKFTEAREQSIQQVTSTPNSSGASKTAGDREMKSPLLARRAQLWEQSENTFIAFAEMRFGFESPKGSSVWPTEFDLAPLVDDLDAMLDMLRRSGRKSKTLESHILVTAADERGVMPAEREQVIAELAADPVPATPFSGLGL